MKLTRLDDDNDDAKKPLMLDNDDENKEEFKGYTMPEAKMDIMQLLAGPRLDARTLFQTGGSMNHRRITRNTMKAQVMNESKPNSAQEEELFKKYIEE